MMMVSVEVKLCQRCGPAALLSPMVARTPQSPREPRRDPESLRSKAQLKSGAAVIGFETFSDVWTLGGM